MGIPSSLDEIEKVLQTYSLDDIFELNEVTQEEVLTFLCTQGFLELPNPRPL